MDGPQQQRTRWRSMGVFGARWRMPLPPGPPPHESKAQKEFEREEEAREEAHWSWLHLATVLRVGAVVMGLALVAIIVLAALALSHH